MNKKLRFDPAWAILIMVAGTLISMNFIDDEHSRNVLAGSVLLSCFILFAVSVAVRSFKAGETSRLRNTPTIRL